MDFNRDNGAYGLTGEQTEKVLQFQDLTGIEDMTICRDVLQRHQWNLEVAVQEQLNIREGRPSVYASESRPPVVFSEHLSHHFYYTPPTDGSASGLRGFVKSVFSFFWNMCYNAMLTVFQLSRRILGTYFPSSFPYYPFHLIAINFQPHFYNIFELEILQRMSFYNHIFLISTNLIQYFII